MAILDLNAAPEEEGEHVPNLNNPPAKQDVHDSLEVAGVDEVNERDPLPGLSLEAAGLGDEQVGLNHDESQEQNKVQGKHI